MEDDQIIEPAAPPEPAPEPAPAPEPEPVLAAPPEPEPAPAWDWDLGSGTPADPPPSDDIFGDVRQGAVQDMTGVLRNQAELRAQMVRQGASSEAIQLAEYTLFSMAPGVMVQKGAAQVAASIAVGSLQMQGKSWKAPAPTTPPPANPVGQPNPTHTDPNLESEKAAFNRAFADLGINADLLEEN